MKQPNWYAPPKALVRDVVHTNRPCKSAGKYLVVPEGSDLPSSCIICNAPVEDFMKPRKFSHSSSMAYIFVVTACLPVPGFQPFLFFLSLFAFIAIRTYTSKSVEITPGFCRIHRQKQKIRFISFVLISITLLIVGGALLKFGMGKEALFSFLAAFIILVLASFVTRTIRLRYITDEYAVFSGCKAPFLDSLEKNTEPIRFF